MNLSDRMRLETWQRGVRGVVSYTLSRISWRAGYWEFTGNTDLIHAVASSPVRKATKTEQYYPVIPFSNAFGSYQCLYSVL